MNPLPTTSKDLLALFNSFAWRAIITKNTDPLSEQNFRRSSENPNQWLDGFWRGLPGQVAPGKGFGIHFVERKRLVWIGEYRGVQQDEAEGEKYSLILDDVQCYEIVDYGQEGIEQSQIRAILKQNGAVIYSYFPPTNVPLKPGPCFRMSAVKIRLQQSLFRRVIFEHYGARCIVTGCEVEALIDAAHLPGKIWYNGQNSKNDGIPLRADLHRALDAGLIELDKDHRLISVDAGLADEYGRFING